MMGHPYTFVADLVSLISSIFSHLYFGLPKARESKLISKHNCRTRKSKTINNILELPLFAECSSVIEVAGDITLREKKIKHEVKIKSIMGEKASSTLNEEIAIIM